MKYDGYTTMGLDHPMLARRLHTLHCESCKPQGVDLSIIYVGADTDGRGKVNVRLQYGYKSYRVSVRKGVIRAFGRIQSMRKPTIMRLSGGRRADYGETDLLV